jgi:hypothetical protein
MKLFNLLINISAFSPLITFAVYLYGRTFNSTIINILVGLSGLALCSDMISKYNMSVGKENLHILDIYVSANLVLAIILYYKIYLQYRRVYEILCTIFLPGVAFCYTIFWREASGGQNINWTICTIIIEVMAIGHFYELCKKPVENISRQPLYWISFGFFFYSSISIMIFSLHKYLLNNFQLELSIYAWTLHNVMNIVKNVCFGVAIWFASDRRLQNSFQSAFKSSNQL